MLSKFYGLLVGEKVGKEERGKLEEEGKIKSLWYAWFWQMRWNFPDAFSPKAYNWNVAHLFWKKEMK